MISDDTSLRELNRILSQHETWFHAANLYPRGWTVELRNPRKGIFIVRNIPSLPEALNQAIQSVLEASDRPQAPRSVPSKTEESSVSGKQQETKSPVLHMKVSVENVLPTSVMLKHKALCAVGGGDSISYADDSTQVTCKRCLRMLPSHLL